MKETKGKRKQKDLSLIGQSFLQGKEKQNSLERQTSLNVQLKIQATTQSALQSLPANHLVFMKEAKINCTQNGKEASAAKTVTKGMRKKTNEAKEKKILPQKTLKKAYETLNPIKKKCYFNLFICTYTPTTTA